MDRDEFIITVSCLVCEHYQGIKNTSPLRRVSCYTARGKELRI